MTVLIIFQNAFTGKRIVSMNTLLVDCFIEMKKKLIKALSNRQNLNLKVPELVRYEAIKIISAVI